MRNILIIARKDLLSAFRQRNLVLIMFLSPVVLVLIMALAFGSIGGSGSGAFTDMPIAVVNLDEGYNLQEQIPAAGAEGSLDDVEVVIGGQTLRLGEALVQNERLNLDGGGGATGDVTLNFGAQIAAILSSQPLTGTGVVSGAVSESIGGFDLSAITCPLLESGVAANGDDGNMFAGSLDDLFDAHLLADAAEARAGVQQGEYVAAVIIPPDFSARLAPDFGLGASEDVTGTVTESVVETVGLVEVVGSEASPISGSIVRAVVEGIVNQFARMNVALEAMIVAAVERVTAVDLAALDLAALDVDLASVGQLTTTLQGLDGAVLAPLGCLIAPGAGAVQVAQTPLNVVQERSPFSVMMVVLGGTQAVFFALFTGVFGINAIYEDRRQGTLQRVLASPTLSIHVMFGRLLGNMVIVFCQLVILLTAFTLIASVVEGELTLIWGTNFLAVAVVLVGLSLFTTGTGALIVGLANSSEQVQLIGPLITLALGALGGVFGNAVPRAFSQVAPTWWGIDALSKLAAQEGDIALNLVVLFSAGVVLAVAGAFFFRRRMGF